MVVELARSSLAVDSGIPVEPGVGAGVRQRVGSDPVLAPALDTFSAVIDARASDSEPASREVPTEPALARKAADVGITPRSKGAKSGTAPNVGVHERSSGLKERELVDCFPGFKANAESVERQLHSAGALSTRAGSLPSSAVAFAMATHLQDDLGMVGPSSIFVGATIGDPRIKVARDTASKLVHVVVIDPPPGTTSKSVATETKRLRRDAHASQTLINWHEVGLLGADGDRVHRMRERAEAYYATLPSFNAEGGAPELLQKVMAYTATHTPVRPKRDDFASDTEFQAALDTFREQNTLFGLVVRELFAQAGAQSGVVSLEPSRYVQDTEVLLAHAELAFLQSAPGQKAVASYNRFARAVGRPELIVSPPELAASPRSSADGPAQKADAESTELRRVARSNHVAEQSLEREKAGVSKRRHAEAQRAAEGAGEAKAAQIARNQASRR